jgi:hypothetical protein
MPAIKKPNQHFDATLYTGTGSALSVTNGGFQPDFVWIKSRAIVAGHGLVDSVRGRASVLYSNDIAAQGTSGSTQDVTAFNSNGFALGTNSQIESNTNASTYVAWQWKGGGTAVSNTSGTITSQVSANPTAGFSVVTYTGTGSNATVGHGLGVAPSMIIVKNRTTTDVWLVQHSSLGPTKYIILNRTDAEGTASTPWNDTAPTSSVFSIGTLADVNRSTSNFVAYCFAPIAGYSAFGSYTGNGSTDGPFVYLGFRPAFIMTKRTNSGDSWFMFDNKRETFNPNDSYINANTTSVEDTNNNTIPIDFVSNGFKIRGTSTGINGSGSTYIYMAFAEAPFKFASAR